MAKKGHLIGLIKCKYLTDGIDSVPSLPDLMADATGERWSLRQLSPIPLLLLLSANTGMKTDGHTIVTALDITSYKTILAGHLL